MSRRSGEEVVLSWQGSEGVRTTPGGTVVVRGRPRLTADDDLIDDLQDRDKPRCLCLCLCRGRCQNECAAPPIHSYTVHLVGLELQTPTRKTQERVLCRS